MTVRVQRDDFDLGTEMTTLSEGDRSIGGVCAFVGLVRDFSTDRPVRAMTLEHYPGMTERELERIEAEALSRWSLQRSLIIHRYGYLEPGDRIVLVATASAHRGDAFESCQFLIDWLKTRAPFWKREETGDGRRWVDARTSDTAAANRWPAKESKE